MNEKQARMLVESEDKLHPKTLAKAEGYLECLEQVRPLVEALKKIACSAPCKDNHESFNSPGQPCDQRIASEALSQWDRIQKGESV